MQYAELCLCGQCDPNRSDAKCIDRDDFTIIDGLIQGLTISKISRSSNFGERTVYRKLGRMRALVGTDHNNGLLFEVGRRLGAADTAVRAHRGIRSRLN